MQEVKKITKQSNEEVENNQQWGEDSAVANLFHIGETIQHPTFKNLPIYRPENDQHSYVDMFQSLTRIEQQLEKNIIVNLDVGSLEGSLKET